MFAVVWKTAALDHLADLYVAAEEKDRMADGVEALNARLADDPLAEGEARSSGFRLTFPPLLAVLFHVDEVNRVVRVTAVSRYGR
jgi:hypothetical protein